MRLATYFFEGRREVGRIDGEHVRPFDLSGPERDEGVGALVRRLADGRGWPPQDGTPRALSQVRLLAPLRPRRNVWCVGRNYHAHARELRDSVFKASPTDPQAWPIVFTKAPECVVGPGDAVHLPGDAVSSHIDYEAELALVIGRAGRNIGRAQAMDHVFGYTIVNDVTARDVQMRHQQWDLGKSFDTFCPMGPWIVTADELDGRDTRVRCWVTPRGGAPELRQDARTTDLIFDLPTLIETCSRGITLLPGDVIATGTPAGVGMGFTPPRWLRDGDQVRIAIDGIGELSNPFLQEP
ncbi:MAG: fumarylacetoacetate hydrolase family protein [Rubrivivax sp.]